MRAQQRRPTSQATSFHPRKLLTTGEGGMPTTDDADIAGEMAPVDRGNWCRFVRYIDEITAPYKKRVSKQRLLPGGNLTP